MHVVTFIKPHLGSKCHIFRRGTKRTGEEKAIKMMWLSHHAARCPLSLHHQSFPFPLAMMLFLCHPMWEGGGGEGGHRGQTLRGNQSSLSLCDSISRLCTHEWMPRHWVQSQRTSRGTHKVFSEDRTGWTVYALMEGNKKKRKKGELWGRAADKQIWDRIPARLRLTSRNN